MLCEKLVHNHIPVFADEKVNAMIREIKFLRPEELEAINPMSGAWQAEKHMMECLGIYLKGSGAEFTWLEADMHAPLRDGELHSGCRHQALHGISLTTESMYALSLKAFLQHKDDQCTPDFRKLKTHTNQGNNSVRKKLVEDLCQSKLLSEYSNFIKEKVLRNGHSSAKASSCQSTATSSRRRY